jgi:hypothetical protein
MTLELRWIFNGQIPDHVKNWFYHDKGHNDRLEKQSYEDIYLYTPEVDYSSVKFRDKKLDIKWKRSSFELKIEPFKSSNISGIVEDWVFWEWNERKTAEEIEEQITKNRMHPWIRIMKERSRYNYRYKDGSLQPVSNKGAADCSIEITTLELKNTKNFVWWSIGIDLFAGKNISGDEKKEMNVISKLLLSNYPETNLIYDMSYSYPKLFSLNRERII